MTGIRSMQENRNGLDLLREVIAGPEEALRSALSRFEAIIENTPLVAIQGYDTDGTIRHWNGACQELYGYDKKEAIGQKMQDLLFSGEDVRRFKKAVRDIVETGQPGPLSEWKICTRDGGHRWVYSSMFPILEHGSVSEIFCMDVDITGIKLTEDALRKSRDELEQRVTERTLELARINESLRGEIVERLRAEEELKEAKSQAELYLDLISHDINNMNQAGIGYLEIALESQEIGPGVKSLVARTLQSLHDSSLLISNVAKLPRVRTGRQALELMDVGAIIDRLIVSYASIPGRTVSIECTAACECHVAANELLVDVFSNILGNSVKHSSGDLEIRIRCEIVPVNGRKYCRISIDDTGPGITDDLKERLFTRFQRGETRASGKGLGLYIVRALVEDFQGMVWVEDRVPGDHRHGCRFVVMLPLAGPGEPAAAGVPHNYT